MWCINYVPLFLVGTDDFVPSPVSLTFQPTLVTGVRECGEVLIEDDMAVEDTEVFIVLLSSADQGVMLGLNSTLVAIVENDRE